MQQKTFLCKEQLPRPAKRARGVPKQCQGRLPFAHVTSQSLGRKALHFVGECLPMAASGDENTRTERAASLEGRINPLTRHFVESAQQQQSRLVAFTLLTSNTRHT
jgi:hypothetical protein